jgi:hypothetical protein
VSVPSESLAPGPGTRAKRVEATMRYALVGLLLLFAGCATYPPPATDFPIAPVSD